MQTRAFSTAGGGDHDVTGFGVVSLSVTFVMTDRTSAMALSLRSWILSVDIVNCELRGWIVRIPKTASGIGKFGSGTG